MISTGWLTDRTWWLAVSHVWHFSHHSSCILSGGNICQVRHRTPYAYLIFVIFFTRTHFKSWKFYTWKVRKFSKKLPKTVFFWFFWNFLHSAKIFTRTAFVTNFRYDPMVTRHFIPTVKHRNCPVLISRRVSEWRSSAQKMLAHLKLHFYSPRLNSLNHLCFRTTGSKD